MVDCSPAPGRGVLRGYRFSVGMQSTLKYFWQSYLTAIAAVVLLAGNVFAVDPTGTHHSDGYLAGSTTTTTVNCEFSYPEDRSLLGLKWNVSLPAG